MNELQYIKLFLGSIELLSHDLTQSNEGKYYRCHTSDKSFTMFFPNDKKLNPRII